MVGIRGAVLAFTTSLFLMMNTLHAGELAWVPASNSILPSIPNVSLVQGGSESNGEALYVCRAPFRGGVHAGKTRPGLPGCGIGFGGRERFVSQYEMLVNLHPEWIQSRNGNLPSGFLIETGPDSGGQSLFVCRAQFRGGMHLGKIRPELGGCSIGERGRERIRSNYEVMVEPELPIDGSWAVDNRPVSLVWAQAVNGEFPSIPNAQAVIGGNEANGDPLFVCRAPFRGGVHGGQIRFGSGGCVIGYAGSERTVRDYEVLMELQPYWAETTAGSIAEGNLVNGGAESDGTPLFVCRTLFRGGTQNGKTRPGLNGCNFGFGGSERSIRIYQTLAFGEPQDPTPQIDVAITTQGGVVTDSFLTLEGTAPIGSSVQIFDSIQQIGHSIQTDINGVWATNITLLGFGDYEFTAEAVDQNGTFIDRASVSFSYVVTTPEVSILLPRDGATVTQKTLTFKGTGNPGDQIEILDYAERPISGVSAVEVDQNGEWRQTVLLTEDGEYNFYAQATNWEGVSVLSQEVLVTLFTIGGRSDGVQTAPENVVRFDPGTTGASLDGSLADGATVIYSLGAGAGQNMRITLDSFGNRASFQIHTARVNGPPLPGAGLRDDARQWQGSLPTTGDYKIIVTSQGGATNYVLQVEITGTSQGNNTGSGNACGWYAILACDRSIQGARAKARTIGMQNHDVINSSDAAYPNFNPGWFCVVEGPYSQEWEAEGAAGDFRARGVRGAYTKNAC